MLLTTSSRIDSRRSISDVQYEDCFNLTSKSKRKEWSIKLHIYQKLSLGRRVTAIYEGTTGINLEGDIPEGTVADSSEPPSTTSGCPRNIRSTQPKIRVTPSAGARNRVVSSLQAFIALGRQEIPAVVIDAPEEDCFAMSLVENRPRRQQLHRYLCKGTHGFAPPLDGFDARREAGDDLKVSQLRTARLTGCRELLHIETY